MSLKRTFTIAGLDVSSYVQKDSMQITYEPIKGLDDVITEDLVLHDDLLGYKRIFTFNLNVLSEASAQMIINLLRQSLVTVGIFDPATGESESIPCKPDFPSASLALTHMNGAAYWSISNIVLTERSGHNV